MPKQHFVILLLSTIILATFIGILTFVQPTKKLQPKYNFLYTNYMNFDYTIKNKKLVKDCQEFSSSSSIIPNGNNSISKDITKYCQNYGEGPKSPKLLIHNVQANNSKEISFEEAQKLNLNSNPTSTDGLIFNPNYNSKNTSISAVLSGGNSNYPALVDIPSDQNLKLNLSQDNNYGGGYNSYSSANFVGWIEN